MKNWLKIEIKRRMRHLSKFHDYHLTEDPGKRGEPQSGARGGAIRLPTDSTGSDGRGGFKEAPASLSANRRLPPLGALRPGGLGFLVVHADGQRRMASGGA